MILKTPPCNLQLHFIEFDHDEFFNDSKTPSCNLQLPPIIEFVPLL